MSKKNKNEKKIESPIESTVAYVTGAGALDITDVMNSQSSEYVNLDEDLEEKELSLEEEAEQLKADFDADPELKKDVLADYAQNESNDTLDNLASSISKHDSEQLAHYETLLDEVTDEMKALNQQFIDEDKLLESSIVKEVVQDEAAQMLAEMTGTSPDDGESDEVEIEELSEQDQELRAALPQTNDDGEYDLEDLQSCIEALLFYSDRPVSLKKLKDMLEMPEAEDAPLLAAIEGLKAVFAEGKHGFEIAEIAGGYQLRTKISKAPLLRKLAKVQVQRLSRGAMETLTIVAYKQPCTKDDIDKVRGVDSSHFIRTLLDRKLIEITGRAEAMGRPMVYATTDIFLEVFGLMDLKAMPSLREIEAMVPQLAAAEEGAEDPRIVQMRKMVQHMKTESNSLDYSAKEDEVLLQEIRDRVKSIEISTPFLETQKQMADSGMSTEEILAHQLAQQPPVPPEQPELLSE